MDSVTQEFAQWVLNQGAGLAVAILVLWRFDTKLDRMLDHLDAIRQSQGAIIGAGLAVGQNGGLLRAASVSEKKA